MIRQAGLRALLISAFLAISIATPANGQNVSQPEPIGNPGEWVTNDDYPAAALASGVQGAVRFSVAVDATGLVTGCDIVESSGSTDLDDATCKLLRERARFRPAHDSAGRGVPGHFVRRTVWRLLEPEPTPFSAFSQTATFDVAADGSVISCRTDVKGSYPEATFGPPCKNSDMNVTEINAMKGPLVGQPVTLTLQVMLVPDGEATYPAAYERPGVTAAAIGVLHLAVARDGTVATCTPIRAVGPSTLDQICKSAPIKRFTPATEPTPLLRGATFTASITVAPLRSVPKAP